MRHKLWIGTIALSLLLGGCAQTAPDLNGGKNNISDVNEIAGQTVTIDENKYGNESGNTNNSSSDGFRSIYFAFGDYEISSDMQMNMNRNIEIASSSNNKIKIEGNCDEFGTDEYNYALGLKRAKAVKDSIVSQGIAPAKMIMVSFGESNPVCTEPSDSCYDRNRRVDIRLVK